MKARHEFANEKYFLEYVKIYSTIEFIKAAIISDGGITDTKEQLTDECIELANSMIEKLRKKVNQGELRRGD